MDQSLAKSFLLESPTKSAFGKLTIQGNFNLDSNTSAKQSNSSEASSPAALLPDDVLADAQTISHLLAIIASRNYSEHISASNSVGMETSPSNENPLSDVSEAMLDQFFASY